MKKSRLIFFAVFGAFHLFLVILTTYIDSQKGDFAFLTELLGFLPLMKWGAFLGFTLLVIDVVWSWIINRDSQKEKDALTHELHTLKAKLFDLQEAEKKAQQAPKAKT
jgi:hypothetical protein